MYRLTNPTFVNLLIFLVPSIAPSGLRVSRLQFSELKVQWNPIPQHSVNGRLLGYVVYYQKYPYYWYSTKRVNTSSPDVHMLVLSDLKAAHSYRVWVAGFTRELDHSHLHITSQLVNYTMFYPVAGYRKISKFKIRHTYCFSRVVYFYLFIYLFSDTVIPPFPQNHRKLFASIKYPVS